MSKYKTNTHNIKYIKTYNMYDNVGVNTSSRRNTLQSAVKNVGSFNQLQYVIVTNTYCGFARAHPIKKPGFKTKALP